MLVVRVRTAAGCCLHHKIPAAHHVIASVTATEAPKLRCELFQVVQCCPCILSTNSMSLAPVEHLQILDLRHGARGWLSADKLRAGREQGMLAGIPQFCRENEFSFHSSLWRDISSAPHG